MNLHPLAIQFIAISRPPTLSNGLVNKQQISVTFHTQSTNWIEDCELIRQLNKVSLPCLWYRFKKIKTYSRLIRKGVIPMTNKTCWRNMTLTGSTFMSSLIMLMYRALRHQSKPSSSVTWRLAKDKIRYDRYHTCLFVYISIIHTRVALRLLCSCQSFDSTKV